MRSQGDKKQWQNSSLSAFNWVELQRAASQALLIALSPHTAALGVCQLRPGSLLPSSNPSLLTKYFTIFNTATVEPKEPNNNKKDTNYKPEQGSS